MEEIGGGFERMGEVWGDRVRQGRVEDAERPLERSGGG